MTTPPTAIVGFTSTDKVPGFVGEVKYGAGATGAGSLTNVCLVSGTKTSAGTATANQDIVTITSADDADTLLGAGSEIARMCYAALRVPGVTLKAMPMADPGGVAGTLTVTFTGTATAAGSFAFRLDGEYYEMGVASGDTPTVAGNTLVSTLQAHPRLPIGTPVNTAGAVVIPRKNVGARGNQGSFFPLTANMPAGMTAAVSVGTSLSGGGYRFASGTLTEDPTTAMAVLLPTDYRYVALAHNDTTSLTGSGKWQTTIDAKAGPLEGRPTFAVYASNAATLPSSATSLNDALFQCLWLQNGESHPSEMAAYFAALRSVTEQADPGAAYDGQALTGVAPQASPSDIPARSTLVSTLNSGVTPLTTKNGNVLVVRSITTHSLTTAGAPDYNTLDTSDAVVPQYIRLDLGLLWASVFGPSNPRVDDDRTTPAKSGVATPTLWNAYVEAQLRRYEGGVNGSPPLVVDVDDNKPTSGYDSLAKRIMTLCPVKVAPSNHQVGVSIRQTNLA